MTENLTADQLAAQARIAAHMARLAANRAATTTTSTDRTAVPAAAPSGWSAAAAHRAGRATRSQSANYRSGYSQSADTQTWDWS